MDNKDNNLSISMENYQGTRAYSGFENSDLKKGFSEEPEVDENKEPTPKDVHKNEVEQAELKKAEAAKNDKKYTYKTLSEDEKRAMKILCNIENKTAREKIEDVMDHLGVSKMGAINILADATKEVSAGKEKVDEKESKSEPKEEKKTIEKAIDRLGDYLEKAKYTKRTGTPGNYKYEYPDDKKGNSGKDSGGEKATFSTGGSTYNTRIFRSKDAANKFMSENKGHGVIGEYGNIIHVAKNSDKGTPNPKPPKTQNAELENITNAMNRLEEQIQSEQKYISKHGEFNDSGEYDQAWEDYKRDAQFNLDKWDDLKKERDEIKARLNSTKITKENLSSEKVKEGLSNKFGMDFEDSPEVRSAVKKEVDGILKKLRSSKKESTESSNVNIKEVQDSIQNELGQEIKNIKEHDGFLIFDSEDGIRRSNKLTKTGKHKKNSVRVHQ